MLDQCDNQNEAFVDTTTIGMTDPATEGEQDLTTYMENIRPESRAAGCLTRKNS
jgi:hypothetical protein